MKDCAEAITERCSSALTSNLILDLADPFLSRPTPPHGNASRELLVGPHLPSVTTPTALIVSTMFGVNDLMNTISPVRKCFKMA